MPLYRIYVTTSDGHVAAPPSVIECADDQEAIGKAAQFTNGKSVELWEGARFIVRFPSDENYAGGAVARSLAEQAPAVPRESLPNRYEPPFSETDFHLRDHQQLRGHFLGGSRERMR
jgi:hypothetical protein